MTEFPETSPKIDWAMYKQSIPSAGLVDKFQKEYESLTIPYPPDNYTSKIDETAKSKVIIAHSSNVRQCKNLTLLLFVSVGSWNSKYHRGGKGNDG